MPADSSFTPAWSSSGCTCFQVKRCLAAVRLMTRPAPWLADARLATDAAAAHDEAGRRHRARDDAEHARAGRRRALAVDDHVAAAVALLPGEVVVVLDAGEHAGPEVRARRAWMIS